jgi:hypothetical protein
MLVQFKAAEIVERETTTDPYRNLLIAMIERAIMDALNQSKANNHLELKRLRAYSEDALAWLFDDTHAPLSFVGICEYLDYSPGCIRAAIRKGME